MSDRTSEDVTDGREGNDVCKSEHLDPARVEATVPPPIGLRSIRIIRSMSNFT